MTKNIIRIEQTENGYLVSESGFPSPNSKETPFLSAYQGYWIEREGKYIVCLECLFRDYMRVGPKRSDIESSVISVKNTREEAKDILWQKISKEATEMLNTRGQGYILENLTDQQV